MPLTSVSKPIATTLLPCSAPQSLRLPDRTASSGRDREDRDGQVLDLNPKPVSGAASPGELS